VQRHERATIGQTASVARPTCEPRFPDDFALLIEFDNLVRIGRTLITPESRLAIRPISFPVSSNSTMYFPP
jgi:hypothetical protein